jgi:peptidoglycan L-alanyl-D-glutamate endopeptidase CwlK
MSEFVDLIKSIQRHIGAEPDGVFGPRTAAQVWRELNKGSDDIEAPTEEAAAGPLNARTLRNIETLDAKARPLFLKFALLSNATAATFGCEYVMTDGNRTWAEQDALYAKGRTAPGQQVTKAKGGFSNHNFGIAGDFGVFRRGQYLDDGNRADQLLASRVHKACSMHAAACGLVWGGNWKSIVDQPHYEVATELSLAEKRATFNAKGSVL